MDSTEANNMALDNTGKNIAMTVAKLDDVNYYNNTQQIIRVKIEANENYRYYDFPLLNTGEYPNPGMHHVLLFTHDDTLEKVGNAILPTDEVRLQMPPGYSNGSSLLPRINDGYAILINTNAKNNTTKQGVSHMGNFNLESNLASDRNEIRHSISPALNKNYTTTEDQFKTDKDYQNIGIFVTDNSIVLKTEGGTILLGPDGISLLGPKTESHQITSGGVMADNPLTRLPIPATLMTPMVIPNYPNIDFIMALGNNVNRMVQTGIVAGRAVSAVSALA